MDPILFVFSHHLGTLSTVPLDPSGSLNSITGRFSYFNLYKKVPWYFSSWLCDSSLLSSIDLGRISWFSMMFSDSNSVCFLELFSSVGFSDNFSSAVWVLSESCTTFISYNMPNYKGIMINPNNPNHNVELKFRKKY